MHEIRAHGIEHEQNWQGAGVANTPFTKVVTGIGDCPWDAGQDALDAFYAQCDPDKITLKMAEEIQNDCERLDCKKDAHNTCREVWLKGAGPKETVGQFMTWHEGCELHHYVTISWRE